VFFSDIADFTATTDDLESEELTGLLNHYLTEMSKIALEHGATIDKYVGEPSWRSSVIQRQRVSRRTPWHA
jgi:adenylate cyclase